MSLIDPSDPLFFTESSSEPYDRHHYQVIKTDGKSLTVESWEEAQSIWWNTPSSFLSHIDVLDKKEVKGFK